MPSFGAKLKSEREKRAITLEQISASTKIGTRMLEALEQEKFNQLPGGIFNKGFVRAYARCLDLDEDQAVADYLEASGEAAVPRVEPEAHGSPAAEPGETQLSRELPWGLFAAILLVVAVVLSVWSYRKREHRARPAASPSAAAIQKSAPPPASAAPSLTPLPAGDSGKPLAAASPNLAPDATAAPARKMPPASPAPPPVGAAASAQLPGEFVVLIQAREDSWLLIIADGETLPSELLSAGTKRAVHGRKQVVIRAGNAGGLDFFFNRKKLPPQGEPGQVKTLTFGPQGLLPNALPPPITP